MTAEDALVVCVPNFSEGRRPGVVEAIVAALDVPGARVVYRQTDPEHNRLDTTVIGSPDAVRRSALGGAAKAAELIDMDAHRGGHPRMGAVDVIPFVPLRGISMDECVELARAFAKELAETLDLPVYLYDRAALSEDRRSLAEVRRGEYEGLREAVARGERLPDLGPHRIGRAGATAVGARKALIAFNVYLSGEDEDAAKAIARAVRESSGGLPAVRAIGFAVPQRGCVTVSMNLVDFEVTGPRLAFDAIRDLAAERGMDVLSSEIVGLVPQAAISEDDVADLRLEGFDADGQILERLVSAVETPPGGPGGIAGRTIERFLEGLASDAPTPGGGAAAGLAGAAGAALIAMVCRLTIDNPKYEEAWDLLRETLGRADAARARFLELADQDVASFDAVMEAFRLPKDTDVQRALRAEAIQRGYLGAASIPLDVARLAVDVLGSVETAIQIGNPGAASDGLSAAHLLHATAFCAFANVEINVAALKDESVAAAMRTKVEELKARARELLEGATAAFAARV